MSMGYGGKAEFERESENAVAYKYSCYNLNIPGYDESREKMDGTIWIRKSALEKYKAGTSLSRLLLELQIRIENASGTWQTTEGIDIIGNRLLMKILDKYKEQGTFPERVGVYW